MPSRVVADGFRRQRNGLDQTSRTEGSGLVIEDFSGKPGPVAT
jgi:hypothetical protein